MPRVRFVPRLVTALALSGAFVSAAPVPQAAATPQQPTVAEEVFRVDVATGALMPLEVVKTKTEGGMRSWYTYLPGAASTIAIPYGEPLVFASRDVSLPEVRLKNPFYKIEPLAVKDGKRYATKQYIPLDVETYGQPIAGLDRDKK